MAGLAENTLDRPSAGRRIAWVVAVLAGLLLVGAAAWWLKGQLSAPTVAKRQVARISILPDTPPPPPPPPPKEEPKPQARDDNKPPPPDLAPKAAAPVPANEPIKMEGAAGSGDSPFAAGKVNSDYQGGAPTVGGAAGKPAATTADRAQERLYANTTRGQLRDEIEKHLKTDVTQLAAEFTLWLDADGSIKRFELAPSGNAQTDAALGAALEETRLALRLPAPPAGLRPMRFKLSVRPQG